jgi:hypothetical protein
MGTIIDYVPERSAQENPYIVDSADLVAAHENADPKGPRKASFIEVEAGEKTDKETGETFKVARVQNAKRLLSEAARDAGYTARFKNVTVNDDKTATIIVTLSDKVVRRTKEQIEADELAALDAGDADIAVSDTPEATRKGK